MSVILLLSITWGYMGLYSGYYHIYRGSMRIYSVKTNGWHKTISCLLGLAFLLQASSIPRVNSIAPLPTNIQPDLLQLVNIQPNSTVAVIIQKYATDRAVEQVVEQLGGKITKHLSIIHGLAAEFPISQLKTLARFPGVRWISIDAPVIETQCQSCVNTTNLQNRYNQTIGADKVWNEAPYLQGQGIGVAVVDSGIQSNHPDLKNQLVAKVHTNIIPDNQDSFGHGSFVAGIIGGNGAAQQGAYIGVAPKTNLIDVRVTTLNGNSTESDVVAGLQWIYENRAAYNIRVVNLSFNSSTAQSYHTSPLDAACEVLWFNGIVVVTAAGNSGAGVVYPPANDPFVITVGATDEMDTLSIRDDTVASFSVYGTTTDGFAKPDLVAPGRKIVGPLSHSLALLALQHPTQVVNQSYIRMSGTSISAPVVSGAIALLLQDEPHLTPDQVKYRLMATANKNWPGYDPIKTGAGYLDIYSAIHSATDTSANGGLLPSRFLNTGHTDLLLLTLTNGSVNWSSVNWSSMNWGGDYWERDPANLNLLGNLNLFGRSDTVNLQEQSADERMNTLFLPVIVTNTAAE